MNWTERLVLIAFIAVITGAMTVVLQKSLEHERRTLELARQIDEQAKEIHALTKGVNELYERK